MTPEDRKALMALQFRIEEGEHEAAVEIGRRYIEALALFRKTASGRNPPNCEVQCGIEGRWEVVTEGTRDYCVGYAEAKDEHCPAVDCYRVVLGRCVLWPEKWYLNDTEETIGGNQT